MKKWIRVFLIAGTVIVCLLTTYGVVMRFVNILRGAIEATLWSIIITLIIGFFGLLILAFGIFAIAMLISTGSDNVEVITDEKGASNP